LVLAHERYREEHAAYIFQEFSTLQMEALSSLETLAQYTNLFGVMSLKKISENSVWGDKLKCDNIKHYKYSEIHQNST
jgi:hypothetical protein